MSIFSTSAAFLQNLLLGGTWDDLAFELRVVKKELQGLQERVDRDLGQIRDRLDRLEGKPGKGRGRSRLTVLSPGDAADAVPKAEAAPGSEAPPPPSSAQGSAAGAMQMVEPTFHGSLTIAEVLATHPEAADVLSRHHLPSCGACAVARTEPLVDGLVNHGGDVDTVLDELNRLVWN